MLPGEQTLLGLWKGWPPSSNLPSKFKVKGDKLACRGSSGANRASNSIRIQTGKQIGNLLHPVLWEGCQTDRSMTLIQLNTMFLSLSSFFLSLTSSTTQNPHHP